MIQDQIFDLTYHSQGAFTYPVVYNMPVYLRIYHTKKLNELFDKERKSHEKAMRKAKSSSPKRSPKFGR